MHLRIMPDFWDQTDYLIMPQQDGSVWIYSISDADEAEKIFFELYNDSGFRERNDSDNQ